MHSINCPTSESHAVRYVGVWYHMTEHEFLRVLEASYDLEEMHSENWDSFNDALHVNERYIKRGITSVTMVHGDWFQPNDLKKMYLDVLNGYMREKIGAGFFAREIRDIIDQTFIFPVENKEEIVKMARDNNFEHFLECVVD